MHFTDTGYAVMANIFVRAIEAHSAPGRALDNCFGIGPRDGRRRLPYRPAAPQRHRHRGDDTHRDEHEYELRPALPAHRQSPAAAFASESVSSTRVSPLNSFCSSENATSTEARCSVR